MKIPINVYEFQKTLIKEVILDVPEKPFTFSCGADMVRVSPIWSKDDKPVVVGLEVVWLTKYYLFEISCFSIYFSSINDLLLENSLKSTTKNRIDEMRMEVITYILAENGGFPQRNYLPMELFVGGYKEIISKINKILEI